MNIVTVWQDQSGALRLAQLSDDPADGIPAEQISYMGSISAYEGYTCVSDDYQGTVPSDDPMFWRWSDGSIVSVAPVPASITPRQVRLLLLNQELLDQVETMISGSDRATQIAWEFASEFKRNDPLLLSLANNLGLTEQQVDQFFIAAAAL